MKIRSPEDGSSTAAPLGRAPHAQSFALTAEGLAAWAQSADFVSAVTLARQYDVFDSLQSDYSRALLYHLVMTLRPKRVLEIGTFRAGTSRFLAKALCDAGSGILHTIDPFGLENKVPETIETWPDEMQRRVAFSPISSAAFFDKAMSEGLTFDLVLIDGNHEFEYAAFDLACVARQMNPGGIVVLDNVDQPGPRFATKLFLEANPAWHEINGAASQPGSIGQPLEGLPVVRHSDAYLFEWLQCDGVDAKDEGVGPVAGFPKVALKSTGGHGYHRVGMRLAGLAPDRKHRLALWLSPLNCANMMFDIRDARGPSSQVFCDLITGTIIRQTGPAVQARLEDGPGGWSRIVADVDVPSGEAHIFVGLQSKLGDVLFDGNRAGEKVMFGGVEVLTASEDGERKREPRDVLRDFAARDLRDMTSNDPFAPVAPSFPDTKFFVLQAPDALIVSRLPRSFGSVRSDASGVKWVELDLASPASGQLYYEVFCRAFSDVAQPEEISARGVSRLELGVEGKIRIQIPTPLQLQTPRESSHYRIEVILAFVPETADGVLRLRSAPVASDTD